MFTVDEELVQEFGQKIPPEEANENAPAGTFMWPTALTVDGQGNTFVADEWLQRITVFNKDGECTRHVGKQGSGEGEFNKPSGLACDADGNVYLVDSYNHRVQVYTGSGEFKFQWGSEGNGDGQFSFPWGIELTTTATCGWPTAQRPHPEVHPRRPIPDEVRLRRRRGRPA